MTDDHDYVHREIEAACEVLAACRGLAPQVARAAEIVRGALTAGGKVLLAGNGGSAADAQHVAGELVGRFQKERDPLAAVALTTDSSVLTAIANDYGVEAVFERQVRGLGRPGDVFVGISTSGRSLNVIRAAAAARAAGLSVVALTGRQGGPLAELADVALCVPADATPHIQEAHITLLHIICGLVEGDS